MICSQKNASEILQSDQKLNVGFKSQNLTGKKICCKRKCKIRTTVDHYLKLDNKWFVRITCLQIMLEKKK